MLKNLLNTEVIQVVEQIRGWRGAVTTSCRPSIENDSIEPHYVDAVYHSHDTIGPYYVIGPGIATPHACPEERASELSLALTLIPSGANSGVDENDPVKLLVVLTATDSASHIETIPQFTKLFDNEKDIQTILTAKTTRDILPVIARYQF